MSVKQTLQKEIAGDEKAIRLLIGEQAALASKLKRIEARLKLERSRLGALNKPAASRLTAGSRFPDVSNWEPNINVAAAAKAASVRVGGLFVTKLTEGTGYVDPLGVTRLKAARNAKFGAVGAYAFLHPSTSGAAQAGHFLSTLHAGGISMSKTDVIIADLEVSDGASGLAVRVCARDFAAEVRKHFPGRLWLYGGGPFLGEYGVPLTGYDAHWLAAYTGNPAPYMVFGRKRTIAWQFSDGKYGPSPHSCPGIGACDMSVIL